MDIHVFSDVPQGDYIFTLLFVLFINYISTILNHYNMLLIYKTLLKSIWTYNLQLWGNAKKFNLNVYTLIQRFQKISLRKITNSLSIHI